jgi:NADPH-dependent glutamate synthase beta subunit-like oxidoreductase
VGIKLSIDGREITAAQDGTVLEAALQAGLYIPHLCHHPDLAGFDTVDPIAACYRGPEEVPFVPGAKRYPGCGLCLVTINGTSEPVLSCRTPVEEGMQVSSSSSDLEALRRDNLAAILTHHPHACLTCAQREGCSLTQCSSNVPEAERCCPQFAICELRKVADHVGIKSDISRYVPRRLHREDDQPLFIRDYNLCIGCLRCVRACGDLVGAAALGYVVVDDSIIVGSARQTLEESNCRFCGACVEVCPTGALRDRGLRPGDREAALVPCISHCPVGIDIPSYVRLIRQGRHDEAAALISRRVPFPLSLGYICSHPCETACRRGELNDAVAICDLKRFALEQIEPRPAPRSAPETGKRVAIVGSGPAGLTAAWFLRQLGHAVSVFEGRSEPGGMLRWALPEYRLPQEILRREIDTIRDSGVEILTDCPIQSEGFVHTLMGDNWDAVFLATGAQDSRRIDIEGFDLDGVHWGLDFLRAAKKGKAERIEGKVAVIGGGNVAVDVAMTALRLGASGVVLACLERRDEMPAYKWEIAEAEEEGIAVHPGWGPERIAEQGEGIRGVQLKRCTSVFDGEGRFNPSYDPSRKMFLEAETVILAIGQKTDLSFLPAEAPIDASGGGIIRVDPDSLETGVAGIFAGGEAAFGPSSAVEAMATGRQAGAAIDRFLGGGGILDTGTPGPEQQRHGPWMEREKGFAGRSRIPMPTLAPAERSRTFDLLRMGYRESEAQDESGRCLQCDLRLRFSPVVLPPETWLEFGPEAVEQIPAAEGAFQLLDAAKKVIFIAGTPNLKQALQEQLAANREARYFKFDEDPMFTKRESELIQQFLQAHGHLPSGNSEVDDLF